MNMHVKIEDNQLAPQFTFAEKKNGYIELQSLDKRPLKISSDKFVGYMVLHPKCCTTVPFNSTVQVFIEPNE